MRRFGDQLGEKRLNLRKWLNLGGLFCFAVVLMLYQNCAPPAATNSSDYGDVPPPGVIDDVNLTTGLSFVQSSLELQSSNLTFDVHGICSSEQSGARLAWSLIDRATNAQVLSGYADCEKGGFRVRVNDSQSLSCGAEHVLTAQLGARKGGEVSVTRRCTPSSSKPINDVQTAAQGLRCFHELDAESGVCEKSCYDTEVLQSKEVVANAACG